MNRKIIALSVWNDSKADQNVWRIMGVNGVVRIPYTPPMEAAPTPDVLFHLNDTISVFEFKQECMDFSIDGKRYTLCKIICEGEIISQWTERLK